MVDIGEIDRSGPTQFLDNKVPGFKVRGQCKQTILAHHYAALRIVSIAAMKWACVSAILRVSLAHSWYGRGLKGYHGQNTTKRLGYLSGHVPARLRSYYAVQKMKRKQYIVWSYQRRSRVTTSSVTRPFLTFSVVSEQYSSLPSVSTRTCACHDDKKQTGQIRG